MKPRASGCQCPIGSSIRDGDRTCSNDFAGVTSCSPSRSEHQVRTSKTPSSKLGNHQAAAHRPQDEASPYSKNNSHPYLIKCTRAVPPPRFRASSNIASGRPLLSAAWVVAQRTYGSQSSFSELQLRAPFLRIEVLPSALSFRCTICGNFQMTTASSHCCCRINRLYVAI